MRLALRGHTDFKKNCVFLERLPGQIVLAPCRPESHSMAMSDWGHARAAGRVLDGRSGRADRCVERFRVLTPSSVAASIHSQGEPTAKASTISCHSRSPWKRTGHAALTTIADICADSSHSTRSARAPRSGTGIRSATEGFPQPSPTRPNLAHSALPVRFFPKQTL